MTSHSPAVEQSAQRRSQLRGQADCRFIDAARFRELLISTRYLIRSDDLDCGLRGLLEPTTGIRFLIEEEQLKKCSAFS